MNPLAHEPVPAWVGPLVATLMLLVPLVGGVLGVLLHRRDQLRWAARAQHRRIYPRLRRPRAARSGDVRGDVLDAYQAMVGHRPHHVWVRVLPEGVPSMLLDAQPTHAPGATRHATVQAPRYHYLWRWLDRLVGDGRPIFRIVLRPHAGDPAGAALLAEELAHVDQWFRTDTLSVRRGTAEPGEDLDHAGVTFRGELLQRAGLYRSPPLLDDAARG